MFRQTISNLLISSLNVSDSFFMDYLYILLLRRMSDYWKMNFFNDQKYMNFIVLSSFNLVYAIKYFFGMALILAKKVNQNLSQISLIQNQEEGNFYFYSQLLRIDQIFQYNFKRLNINIYKVMQKSQTELSKVVTINTDKFQSYALDLIEKNIKQVGVIIQFQNPQTKQKLTQLIENLDQQQLIDDEQQYVEDQDEYKHSFEMKNDEKQIIILLRHFQNEISEISQRRKANIILTPRKIKFYSNDQIQLDYCIDQITEICNNISIHKLDDIGKVIYQSTIYQNFLNPIKTLMIKQNYYFWFKKEQIQLKQVQKKIDEIRTYNHRYQFLIFGDWNFRQKPTLQKLFSKYLTQKLFRQINNTEKKMCHLEIGKSGNVYLLHEKIENYIDMKNTKIRQEIQQCFIFTLSSKKIFNEEKIKKKIALAKDYLISVNTITEIDTTYTFIIRKKDLQKILKHQKHRQTFNKIFKEFYNSSQNPFEIGFYLLQPTEKLMKKHDNIMQSFQFIRSNVNQRIMLKYRPKMIDQNEIDMYINSISKIIQINQNQVIERPLNQTHNSFNNSVTLNDSNLQNTTFIGEDSKLNISNQVPTSENINFVYNINLELTTKYDDLIGNQNEIFNYKPNKRDYELSKKIFNITHSEFKVFNLIIHKQHQPQKQLQNQITLFIQKSEVYKKQSKSRLLKLRIGLKKNGFLVQADRNHLQKQNQSDFICTNSSFYQITHSIEYV